jgi:hypothetical protein
MGYAGSNPALRTDVYGRLTLQPERLKQWVLLPGSNRSANKTGYRAGLYVEVGKRVMILFLGHHSDYKGFFRGNENACFIKMFKDFYPELQF